MTAQVSYDHHTVAKLYLRGFSPTKGPDKGKVLARHRDGSEALMTIKEATVSPGFYDLGEPGEPNDALEQWFSRNVENPVGELMGALRRGAIPPAGAALDTLATFVAVQMVRTIRFRHLMNDMSQHLGPLLFANLVLQRAIDADPGIKQQPNLGLLHAQIAARAPQSVRHSDTKSIMRNMVREADRLRPLLASMTWLITHSPEPALVTGDAPVVTVSGVGEISSVPMLLPDLHEVQMPITPHRLLTITPFPQLGQPTIMTADQARVVNEGVARACADVVIRHPHMDWPTGLTLLNTRPALAAPTVTVTANDGRAPTEPKWPTIVSRAMAEAIDLLGGSPDL